jgi:hypothetical protein
LPILHHPAFVAVLLTHPLMVAVHNGHLTLVSRIGIRVGICGIVGCGVVRRTVAVIRRAAPASCGGHRENCDYCEYD